MTYYRIEVFRIKTFFYLLFVLCLFVLSAILINYPSPKLGVVQTTFAVHSLPLSTKSEASASSSSSSSSSILSTSSTGQANNNNNKDSSNTLTGCNSVVHNIDPNDPYVKPYLKNLPPLNCPQKPQLTYVDHLQGLLLLRQLDTENSISSSEPLCCNYTWIWRGSNDQQLKYSKPEPLVDKVKFSQTNYVVNVSCTDCSTNTVIYKNHHLWIPDFNETRGGVKSNTSNFGTTSGQFHFDDRPSVLIFVIESLGGLSFQRFMKETNRVLDEIGHFNFLNGLNVVGPNSFPNSMGLIAGNAVSNATYERMNTYWDHKLDYVWDHYKRNGYLTGFVEDFVKIGLFDYQKYGFKKAPTDFFPRPFWLQYYVNGWKLYESMKNVTQYCDGSRGTRLEVFTGHLLDWMKKMKHLQRPYFMYSFYSQVTHEDFNNFKLVDNYVANFVKQSKPYMNNTVFILLGDHGSRFGGIADSPIGFYEARKPFFAIRVPESLNHKYPHLRKKLEENKDKLTTWFDINKLLNDTAYGKFSEEPTTNLTYINPWRKSVPFSRNCTIALIPKELCVCNDRIGIDPKVGWHHTEPLKVFLRTINQWLPSDCAKPTRNTTNEIQVHLPSKSESFSLVQRLEFNLTLAPPTLNLTVIMKREAKDLWSPWKPWAIDDQRTDVVNLKSKLNKRYC